MRSVRSNMSDLKDVEFGDLPQLCCCITNKAAAIITGIMSIIARLTCVVIFFVTFFAVDVDLHPIYYIATTIFAICIAFDVLLLYGVFKGKYFLVLPWFFVGLTTAGVLLLIALFEKDDNIPVASLSVLQAMVHMYLPFIILYAFAEIFMQNRTRQILPKSAQPTKPSTPK